MTFTYLNFDVEIVREVDVTALRWPASGEAGDDSGLGSNRQYVDLRGLSWTDAKRVFDLEGVLIARIENAEDADAEYEAIGEESYESDDDLLGLDIGVASTVASLSAARCVPCSSCNGGAFGGHHREVYPLVAFFARRQMAALLVSSATSAGIGLENDPSGCLVAYSDDIRRLRVFAASLIEQRRLFEAVRSRAKGRQVRPSSELEQYKLSFDEKRSR